MLLQQIVNGLVPGRISAFSALGFTRVFGAARVVNFADGEILMLGAFFTLTAAALLGLPVFAALAVGAACSSCGASVR